MAIILMELAVYRAQVFVRSAHHQLYAYHALILTFWLMDNASATMHLNNLEAILRDIVSLARQ